MTYSLSIDLHRLYREAFTSRHDTIAHSDVAATHATAYPIALAFELHELLRAQGQIAIVWHIDDVLNVRPGLTRDQAMTVLERVSRKHDAEHGVSWETFRVVADDMFPQNDQSEGVEP